MDYWEWIGRFDNVLGILTVIFSGYAAYRLWRQNQKYLDLARESRQSINLQQKIRDFEGVNTAKPIALAVCLLPMLPSIKQNVKTYLKSNKMKMPVKEIKMNGINDANDLEALVKHLQDKKMELHSDGCTEVHLFLAGPVAAGVMIGSLLNNWVPIKVYHKPTPSPADVYEYWMPLLKI